MNIVCVTFTLPISETNYEKSEVDKDKPMPKKKYCAYGP